jgi:hypothetical protein
MVRFISKLGKASSPPALIMYHLGGIGKRDRSLHDVYANNLQLFTTALKTDDSAFYLFNVLNGTANPFYNQLPIHLKEYDRMCVIHWDAAVIGDITVAAIAASHLGPVVNAFAAVMYLNQGAYQKLIASATIV